MPGLGALASTFHSTLAWPRRLLRAHAEAQAELPRVIASWLGDGAEDNNNGNKKG